MIRRLTEDDLPAINAILDTRTKIQVTTFTDVYRDALKRFYSLIIKDNLTFFFGRWEDGSDVMKSFTYFMTVRRGFREEMAFGAVWKLNEDVKSDLGLDELLIYATDFLRELKVKYYWRLSTTAGGWKKVETYFDDETKFSKEEIERLHPNDLMTDTMLNPLILPLGAFKTPQVLVKYMDLNAIVTNYPPNVPVPVDNPANHPPRVPVPKVEK